MKDYYRTHKPRTGIRMLSIAIVMSLGVILLNMGPFADIIGVVLIFTAGINFLMFSRDMIKKVKKFHLP